jgi:hypothetical protein
VGQAQYLFSVNRVTLWNNWQWWNDFRASSFLLFDPTGIRFIIYWLYYICVGTQDIWQIHSRSWSHSSLQALSVCSKKECRASETVCTRYWEFGYQYLFMYSSKIVVEWLYQQRVHRKYSWSQRRQGFCSLYYDNHKFVFFKTLAVFAFGVVYLLGWFLQIMVTVFLEVP